MSKVIRIATSVTSKWSEPDLGVARTAGQVRQEVCGRPTQVVGMHVMALLVHVAASLVVEMHVTASLVVTWDATAGGDLPLCLVARTTWC
jgi:hypothetical protein